MDYLGGRARTLILPTRADDRGALVPFAFDDLPFIPRHAFFIHDVPVGGVRGRHAVKNAHQLLICLSGEISVTLRNQSSTETITLDRPEVCLFIAEGLWAEQTYLTRDASLLVFMSEPFDPDAYSSEPL